MVHIPTHFVTAKKVIPLPNSSVDQIVAEEGAEKPSNMVGPVEPTGAQQGLAFSSVPSIPL
jgi:hypothetical protein